VRDWLQIFVLYRYQLKKYRRKLPVKRGLNDMTSLTALLDLRMPELDGVGAIKEIRELDDNAQIVVPTAFDGDEDIYRAIKAGAKAYLLKDTARDALVETVRRVQAGETYLPPTLAAKLAERLSGQELSPRELEVLQRLAVGKSNKEIGAELSIGEGTVKTHIKSIFGKLDVVSRTEAVATANTPRSDSTVESPVRDLKLSWRVAQSAAMLTSSIWNRHNVLEAMYKHEGLTF
jgi:DNA-binding NarL/FixJ family response regulator